ncbi:MAG: transcriptional regulator [Rectinemataceae bacterium]
MANSLFDDAAEHDFQKAQTRALLSRLSNVFTPSREELLPFDAAKKLLQPGGETYAGLSAVPLDKIVGSEGRYRDFNRHFLPRKEYLRQRWVSIDKTHYNETNLPPVRLYEMGGVYFVRDGNHRVSVARSLGQVEIDAEVVSLQTKIRVEPDMGLEELKQAIISYEKNHFYSETEYVQTTGKDDLTFSEPGRYDTIREHIAVHKYFLNQEESREIELSVAMLSWHENVYSPIVLAVKEEKILSLFPGRTDADLYLYIVQHWDELKQSHQKEIGIGYAARDFKTGVVKHQGLRNIRFFGALGKVWKKLNIFLIHW